VTVAGTRRAISAASDGSCRPDMTIAAAAVWASASRSSTAPALKSPASGANTTSTAMTSPRHQMGTATAAPRLAGSVPARCPARSRP
jgi:hypothetical protein